jgi:hypothetical protein
MTMEELLQEAVTRKPLICTIPSVHQWCTVSMDAWLRRTGPAASRRCQASLFGNYRRRAAKRLEDLEELELSFYSGLG